LTIKDSLNYRKSLDEEKSSKYIHKLALIGSEIISKELGTNRLITDSENFAAMFSIRLPTANQKQKAFEVENLFLEKFKISLKCFEYSNELYARFCCQIINEEDDFKKVANVLKSYFI
jgi:hypothetical protein